MTANLPQSKLPPRMTRPRVKICGIRRYEDGITSLELGADFIGIILTNKSPRYISSDDAQVLLERIRKVFPDALVFGVFTNEPAEEMATSFRALNLAAIQVHGPSEEISEIIGHENVIPAIAMKNHETAEGFRDLLKIHCHLLADAFSENRHGGTGKLFDHTIVAPYFKDYPIFVAGGLGPENISQVVNRMQPGPFPYAFDLSSGLETSPGIKSQDKLRHFFREFRSLFPGVSDH